MRMTTLLKFSKNEFSTMLAMSLQNIESHNFDIENHNFDIENYQTEPVKKQEKDCFIPKEKCLQGS